MKVAYLSEIKRQTTPLQVYTAVFDSWKAERDRSQFNYRLYTDTLLQLMYDFAQMEVDCQACPKAAAEWSGLNAIKRERSRRNESNRNSYR